MPRLKRNLILKGRLVLCLLLPLGPGFTLLHSQENVFTAGFQYKPIFQSSFFGSGVRSATQNGIGFSIEQKMGLSAGMVIRCGLGKRFAFESGINYTKRNFDLSLTDTTFSGNSGFKIIGYEIPALGMVFLQMGDKIHTNTSLGLSMDMYPSNISTRDSYFRHFSRKHGTFQFAALANLGAEYRTEKTGIFYLGASYHLPLSWFYESNIMYEPTRDIGRIKLSGAFLTLDLRYYFHEDPIRNKKKKPKATTK